MKSKSHDIKIPLDFIEPKLEIIIYGNRKNTLFTIDNEFASENGMAAYQILEGHFYHYYFTLEGKPKHDYQIRENVIVKSSLRENVSEGRISPNTYVGSLPLVVYNRLTGVEYGDVSIEVLATKLDDNNISKEDPDYRKNYQFMLKDIANKCTELLMQINSPIRQNFEIDFSKEHQTIYQRFAFVSALINNNDFNEAIEKIIASPRTRWVEEMGLKDIRSVRKLSSLSIRQIASRSNRVKLTSQIGILKDVPLKIETTHKSETIDTPENRFVKHALEVFLQFCANCLNTFANKGYSKSKIEAEWLVEKLENHLNQPFFKEIERPQTLKLNSPVLQRKSGYRELLNAWLQFDLAAKLIWKGGDDVYKAGKRDIAALYEYWLFFVLYDLVKKKFNINLSNSENYHHLIEPTEDGLNVMLKSGKLVSLEGTFQSEGRVLHIKFSYNRTFEGGVDYGSKKSGSWTKTLRPDYTLSVWPEDLKDEDTAEEQEQIVHIHFDSKYKVQQFNIKTSVETDLTEFDEDSASVENDGSVKLDSLEKEKGEERKGVYKNADLFKMHTYKDAIRRTGGAYVLYPGSENKAPFKGFHELIPGLGAFAIRPKEGENGTAELSDFIDKIIEHFNNMASQQRRHSNKIYEIHRNPPVIVKEAMENSIIPDETFVIVAPYKSKSHLKWIMDEMKYNGRIGNSNGAMDLTPEFIGAKYLILHKKKNPKLIIFEINQSNKKKPSVVSKENKMFDKYPNASKPFYLIFNLIEKPKYFLNGNYNIEKLPEYSESKDAFPFACMLTDFIQKAKVL
jgi:predicted component of viral defense system (DUF524 family)